MLPFDLQLFRYANNFTRDSAMVQALVYFAAHWLIVIEVGAVVAWVIWTWWKITRRQSWRTRFDNWRKHVPAESNEPMWIAARALFTASWAYTANAIIGFIWFRPRPFVVLQDVNRLIDQSYLHKSFPSDHAAISFAVAWAVYWSAPRLGVVLLITASVVSMARVFAGVHFPTDILAGAILALVWSRLALHLERRWRQNLMAPVKDA